MRDVTVQGNATGIALEAVRAVTVSRARVLGNATGVAATAVREGVLSDSDITGSQVGVAVAAGTDLLLTGNRLQSNVSDVTIPRRSHDHAADRRRRSRSRRVGEVRRGGRQLPRADEADRRPGDAADLQVDLANANQHDVKLTSAPAA